ncbi:MAG: hypothetical protein R2873_31255 [Caldilineaceae bacterium]
MPPITDPHATALDAWDTNAAYWDEYMREGTTCHHAAMVGD